MTTAHHLQGSLESDRGSGGAWPGRALILVAALGLIACVVADWPGHFPPDALDQLAQGRAGLFDLWHPPVMAWMLGVADRLWPGAPLFFVLDGLLFFSALTAFALVNGSGWLGVAVAAALGASPLVLVYQGLVIKDVLFADAAVAAFAAIGWAGKLWRRPRARIALIGLALLMLTLAGLTRQNGPVVSMIGAASMAVTAAMRSSRPSRSRVLALGGLGAVVTLGLAIWAISAGLAARSDHQPQQARQWMTLQVYDLAGAVRRDPALPLPVLAAHAPALERFVRLGAARAYDSRRFDTIATLRPWARFLKIPGPWPGRQWRALITGAPGLYLATRWADFWQVLATPDVQACAPVLVGVDPGDPALLRKAGLAARDTDKDDWDGDYASSFLGTPVFSHLAYAAMAAALLVLAGLDVARGRPELIATVGLLTAAFAFTASFFVISIACDYRYLYFLDAAAMVALVQRAAMWGRAAPKWGSAGAPTTRA